jgi:CheY-like chemotaxis protein
MKTKSQILVVDDDELNREMLSGILSQYDYGVDTASSGYDALQELKERHYDLVLLDLNMPGMGGMQVLKLMNDDTEFRKIPTIVMSATRDKETVLQCIQLGAADFLGKPYPPEVIRSKIEAVLANRRVQDLERLLKDHEEREKKLVAEIEMLRQRLFGK